MKIGGYKIKPKLKKDFVKFSKIYVKLYRKSPVYLLKFSSVEESEAVSSKVEFEVVSDWLPLSLSLSSTGCFKNQYIILAVNVSIIF